MQHPPSKTLLITWLFDPYWPPFSSLTILGKQGLCSVGVVAANSVEKNEVKPQVPHRKPGLQASPIRHGAVAGAGRWELVCRRVCSFSLFAVQILQGNSLSSSWPEVGHVIFLFHVCSQSAAIKFKCFTHQSHIFFCCIPLGSLVDHL